MKEFMASAIGLATAQFWGDGLSLSSKKFSQGVLSGQFPVYFLDQNQMGGRIHARIRDAPFFETFGLYRQLTQQPWSD
jgi:hypothetical protein